MKTNPACFNVPILSRVLGAAVSIAAFAVALTSAHAQSFAYSDFSSAAGLQINGNAAAPVWNGTADVLRLTPAAGNQAGSAFSLNTVQLGSNASFSTAFSFQLTNGAGISDGNSPPNPLGADGIVFVLNIHSNSVGASGQGVGYQGIANSLGVKFDTWQDGDNNGFSNDNDPNGNFVAMYTDGSTHLHDTNPSYSGYNGTGDALSYYSPANSMKNGDIWYAWIDYNGATHGLEMRLSDGVNVRPASPQLSETIDLNDASILGSSPAVYAGFTSGTGGAWDDHDILSWEFNDTYSPIGAGSSVPDAASTFGLLGLGLSGLTALGRFLRKRSMVS